MGVFRRRDAAVQRWHVVLGWTRRRRGVEAA
jgi:hypothetical protein